MNAPIFSIAWILLIIFVVWFCDKHISRKVENIWGRSRELTLETVRGPLFQCLIHLNHKKMFAYMDYCLAMYGGFANIDM